MEELFRDLHLFENSVEKPNIYWVTQKIFREINL